MIEKYSLYEFNIYKKDEEFHYVIYSEGCMPYFNGDIDSDESFETEQEARFAAIGHITELENP
jgi:hypothetical protein